MKTVRVDVTQDDIAAGQQCSSFACPIALAARRVLKDPFPCVGGNVLLTEDANDGRLPLPPAARAFIRRFDHAETVEPFSFELTLPE